MEALFRTEAYSRECQATVVSVDPEGILLDRSVFYPEGGGQPGDRGRLLRADGTAVEIVDTVKGDGPDVSLHKPAEGAALPAPGETVTAEIDWPRRHRLMRMHTAMHLLCSLIEGEVTGGQVGEDKGRLDFNLPDTKLDKEALQAALDDLVARDLPVAVTWIDDAELDARPELVRTMSVKPPRGAGGRVRLIDIEGADLQPCGGTHVARTGEIGAIAVGKIENKGRQNRRVNLRFV